jgi:branched-chain amino acid transport system substrate-binding protein
MTNTHYFWLWISICLFAVGCQQQAEIQIGGAFALSGDAAEWGNDEMQAAQLAIEEANEQNPQHPVQLVTEDTKATAKDTLSAVQKLIAIDEVQVIIGPTWGDSFGSIVGPVGEEAHVVQMSPSAALEVPEDTLNYEYYFSTWYPQLPEIETHMRYLQAHNYTNLVLIHDQDPFNTKFSQLYAAQASKRGITVHVLEINPDTTDFRTVLLKAQQYNADALLLEIFSVDQIGQFLKDVGTLDMHTPVLSSASAQTATLLETAGPYAEGTLVYSFPDTSSARYHAFETAFEKRYGHKPISPSAACAYDAARAVVTVIQNGAISGEEIRDALYALQMEGTIVDTISFNEKGQIATAPFIMKTVRKNEYVELNEQL